MKPLNILGLIVLAAGILLLSGFALFQFFMDPNVPLVVRLGIIGVIIGITILIVSLAREKMREKEL